MKDLILYNWDLSGTTGLFLFILKVLFILATVNIILLIRDTAKRISVLKVENRLRLMKDISLEEVDNDINRLIQGKYYEELMINNIPVNDFKPGNMNTTMCKNIADNVINSISPDFLYKITLYYNINQIDSIIASRVVLFNIADNLGTITSEDKTNEKE